MAIRGPIDWSDGRVVCAVSTNSFPINGHSTGYVRRDRLEEEILDHFGKFSLPDAIVAQPQYLPDIERVLTHLGYNPLIIEMQTA